MKIFSLLLLFKIYKNKIDIYICLFFIGFFLFFIFKIYSNRKIKKINKNKEKEGLYFNESNEELIKEQLKRNYEFFEENGMKLIRNSFIIIVGCDSIGSHVTLTLVRSGIKKLILIDNTKLNEKNFKYHPCAILTDLEKYNIDILYYYSKKINPKVEIETFNQNLQIENLKNIIKKNGVPDYIICCISNINRKKEICELINYVNLNKIKFILSLFPSENKFNPVFIRLEKFGLLKNDKNSKIIDDLYQKLFNAPVPDINTVYSIEKENENEKIKFEINPVFAFFAQTISSKILCDISKIEDNKKDKNNNINNELIVGSKPLSKLIKMFKNNNKNELNEIDNLSYENFENIAKLFKCKDSIKKKNGKLIFIKWRIFNKLNKNNIIILNELFIENHLKIKNEQDLINLYSKEVVNNIDNLLNEIK